jgi:hypothetical protein
MHVLLSHGKGRGEIKRRGIEPRCDCKFESLNVKIKELKTTSTHSALIQRTSRELGGHELKSYVCKY